MKSLKQGLAYEFYEGIFRSIHDWNEDEPKTTGVVPNFTLDLKEVEERKEWFGMEFNGYINIPADGKYTFRITAVDGCQLRIDGKEQFESDGRKEAAFTQTKEVILAKGIHKIGVGYYQCSDDREITVLMKNKAGEFNPIPNNLLFH